MARASSKFPRTAAACSLAQRHYLHVALQCTVLASQVLSRSLLPLLFWGKHTSLRLETILEYRSLNTTFQICNAASVQYCLSLGCYGYQGRDNEVNVMYCSAFASDRTRMEVTALQVCCLTHGTFECKACGCVTNACDAADFVGEH